MIKRRNLRSDLGNTTSIASGQPKKADSTNASISLKYRMQDGVRKLLPSERSATCLRRLQPDARSVKIMFNPGDSSSHYSGCVVCGSVWSCPVCAARISEERRKELSLALSRTDKHAVLVTYTIRHHKPDCLPDLLDSLLDAFRFFKAGRWFKGIQYEYSWFGSVRALETTHGSNGWHPHLHELVLFDQKPDLEQLQDVMRKRWMEILPKFGLNCDYHIGVKLVDDAQYVREYVSKFGREPLVERGGKGWKIEHELTKSNVKRSRSFDGGRTPFQLLYDYIEGDKQAGALFREYALAFKGRNQLVWSRRLREELGIQEISDEMLAAADGEVRTEELAEFDYWDWQVICEMGARGYLLEVARSGDAAQVFEAFEKIHYFYLKKKEREREKRDAKQN